MGLSGRKSKQRIGDDPRNTRWAKNQFNPGFKILSSMGWSPSTTCLGTSANSNEPVRSSWKRLPGSVLPIVQSTKSGLGSNPNQACSNSYLLGAPRFVRATQPTNSVETALESTSSIENDLDRSNKIAIVTGGGGGFDDLLSRLNQSRNTTQPKSTQENHELQSIQENGTVNDSFVLVSVGETTKENLNNKENQKFTLRSSLIDIKNRKNQPNKPKKRVRILGFCQESNQKNSTNRNLHTQEKEEQGPKLKKIKKNPSKGHDAIQQSEEATNTVNANKKPKIVQINKPTSSLISNLTHLRKPEPIIKEDQNQESSMTTALTTGETTNPVPLKISRPINPRVASRAKYINSKKMASSQNAAAMAEILGIPPPISTISA